MRGHTAACAKLLNKETKKVLEHPPVLWQASQDELLKAVNPVFTDDDDKMLESEWTDNEFDESLKKSNRPVVQNIT